MSDFALPNNFWTEFASGSRSVSYKDLEADPELRDRITTALTKYGYRILSVGDQTAKNDWYYTPGSWSHPDWPRQIRQSDYMIVRRIAKASDQP